MTVRDLVTEAAQELGIVAAGETLAAADAELFVQRLIWLFDSWNAERAGVYADRLTTHTLTPSLQPHTIGPSGTFTVSQRPVSIDGANLVLTNVTPNVYVPIAIRDIEWFRELPAPTLEASIPTDLYYEAGWPNGSLYLWPVPTTAYGLELQTRIVLSALTLADTFTMPPGYREAVTLTLAEKCARPFGRPVADDLRIEAMRARGRVFANNDETPRLCTVDAGMPAGGGGSTFNYRTGR